MTKTHQDADHRTAIVMGASSGMGHAVACQLLEEGWRVAVAARRTSLLEPLCARYPGRVVVRCIDINDEDASQSLLSLMTELGAVDLYFHVAGVGYQNYDLEASRELLTVQTNALGFARLVGTAFRFFAQQGRGHLAVLSSIAGTKGLGAAPAYSATKAFQNTYIQALEQQAHFRKLPISFTDIRPGFVATALLNDGKHYPMLMSTERVARHIVRALKQKRHVCVIDWRYRVLTGLWRLIPNVLWRHLPVRN